MSLLDRASLIITPNAYKEGKLYSVIPNDDSGDMNVFRSTTATRVNEIGLIESVGLNTPRIDYTDGGCPGILVEPQRTNNFLYSEDLGNVVWSKTNCFFSPNFEVSPDGNTNADKLTPNSGQLLNFVLQDTSVIINNDYTLKFYAKASGLNFIQIVCDSTGFTGTADWVNFDLLNGVWGNSVENNIIQKSFKELDNGWFEISITKKATVTTSGRFLISAINANYNSRLPSNIGNGIVGVSLWGMQFEQGAYATSYIPTTTSTLTRNADVISKDGVSGLIGQTEGTLFWEGYIDSSFGNYSYFPRLFILGDGSTSTLVGILITNTNILRGVYIDSTGAQAQISLPIGNSSKNYKIAFAYKENDFVLYVDGVNVGSVNSGTTITSLSLIAFGRENGDNTTPSVGLCKIASLWKTRLTNTELEALTTI